MTTSRKMLWIGLALAVIELLAGTRLSEGLLRRAWRERGNNLFNNGNWIVGKDEGRFVFYTYDFMFDPLENKSVNLNARMGYQQIFHRELETDHQRLQELSFSLRQSNRGYTWVFLHRQDEQRLGIRLSRQENRPGGAYRFDAAGEPVLVSTLSPLPPSPAGVPTERVTLSRADGSETWTVRVGETTLGSFTDPGSIGGQIGFGGNGYSRSINTVGDITFSWTAGSRSWTTHERFQGNRPTGSARTLLWAAALLVVGIRMGRRLLLMPLIAPKNRLTWWGIDTSLALVFLSVFYISEAAQPALRLPLALLLAEALAIGLPIAFRRHTPSLSLSRPAAGLTLLITTLTLVLFPLAAVQHGAILFSGKKAELPAELGKIDPSVFIRNPDPAGNPAQLAHADQTLVEGQPWFSDPYSFRDQEITARFRMPAKTTLDLLFQQQSYLSRGDPNGEAIPMQRRLLRFSTHPKITAQGLAQQTGRQPNPFRPFSGSVSPDTEHHLTVRVENDTITLTLDDQTTVWDHTESLGFGITGWMAWDHSVELLGWSVTPLEAGENASRVVRRTFLGLLAIPLLWFLFLRSRNGATVSWLSALTLWPLTGLAALALMVSPGHLSSLGTLLPALFSGAVLTGLFTACIVLILLRVHLHKVALLFNLLFLAIIGFGGIFVWNGLLPANHALKVNLRKGSTVTPGDLVKLDIKDHAPWYAANRSIGANIYVWRQAFAGENISQQKTEGTLRVFYTGGSQAWGSGASSTQETVPGLLETAIDDPKVQVINAAVNGSGGSGQRAFYIGQIRPYQPDILIVDNGLNDTSALARQKHRLPLYLSEFEELLQACKEDGVAVIWMAEPMSEEAPLRPLSSLYDGYHKLVDQYGFVAIDQRGAVVEAERDRFVWWDTAHLAPYGQRLLARQLEPALREALNSRRLAKKE